MSGALAKVAQGFNLKRALNVAAMALATMVALIGFAYTTGVLFGAHPWWYALSLSLFAGYGTVRLVHGGWGSLDDTDPSGSEVS